MGRAIVFVGTIGSLLGIGVNQLISHCGSGYCRSYLSHFDVNRDIYL